MEMDIIDSVPATCLEPGDFIQLDNRFHEIRQFNDLGDKIVIVAREVGYDDDEPFEFTPAEFVAIYGYSSVEV